MTSAFAKEKPFPPVPEDGKIVLNMFLEAAKGIPNIIDLLGMQFKPVKSDINGNITKIQKHYDKNPAEYVTVNSILEAEKEAKVAKDDSSATTGVLWLKRGLEFMLRFFEELIKDFQSGAKKDSTKDCVNAAYEATLVRHHSWMSKKVFGMMSGFSPKRVDMMKHLAYGVENKDEQVINEMDVYAKTLGQNVAALNTLLLDMGIEEPVKETK
ncbi:hypothetical protein ACJMK2_011070 [Sinanodonta woodiana]|uniref:Glycolipid transfer protein domain-containing protein n=1 Tax=Sinanodonta woodiana TaxID=1069815 RepID=A0ABD3V6X1_SINWO